MFQYVYQFAFHLHLRQLRLKTHSLDEALELAAEARDAGKPLSIGLVGNAVDTHKAILDKGFKIDIITDQTSAHDPLNGYVPQGYSINCITH